MKRSEPRRKGERGRQSTRYKISQIVVHTEYLGSTSSGELKTHAFSFSLIIPNKKVMGVPFFGRYIRRYRKTSVTKNTILRDANVFEIVQKRSQLSPLFACFQTKRKERKSLKLTIKKLRKSDALPSEIYSQMFQCYDLTQQIIN